MTIQGLSAVLDSTGMAFAPRLTKSSDGVYSLGVKGMAVRDVNVSQNLNLAPVAPMVRES